MPKFYVELLGTLQVRWGIEMEAATRDIAEAEALRSAPEDSNHWALGTNPVTNIEVDEVSVLPQETPDRDLGRLELETKYTADHGEGWGHHPLHTRKLWQHCVACDDTVDGYWDWVYNKLQNEDVPDGTQTSPAEE